MWGAAEMDPSNEDRAVLKSGGGHRGPTNPFAEFEKADVEQSIAARFEQQAREYGGRIAVKSPKRILTYDQLNRASNRLAHALLKRCANANEPVALLFKQGGSMITASLAALKAGKTYAPLDYTLPRAKAREILQHIQPSIVVTDSDNLSLARDWAEDPAKVLNSDALDVAFSDENPGLPVSPDDPAYINYTSGSTGEPKGVVWSHRNELYSTMQRINALHISPDDRISLLRSSNVGATRDMFLALLSGAALLPLELKEEGMAGLGRWLIEEAVTVYSCVATVFRHSVENLTGSERFPKIRLIHIGGEPLAKSDVELYKKYFSDECLFVSRFGMSETPTVSYYFVSKQTEIREDRVPVGYPLEGNQVMLLDGKSMGVNCVGEIAVKSRYLALGYWRQPELTGSKFLPDPDGGGGARIYHTGDLGYMLPDGCLVHVGRKDFQIKVRGHRVELSEVEMALLQFDGVKQAAVVAGEDAGNGRRLAAYVVPQAGRVLATGELRAFLKEKLPSYMLPSSFVILESLPLTASGKVDRRALPAADRSRHQLDTPYSAPATAVEKVLVKLWTEVLGIAEVGIHDEFPQLGGDSLLSARIVSRVNDIFSLKRPVKFLFETPTVARLSAFIVAEETTPGQSEKIARISLKVEGMSAAEIRTALAAERGKRGDA